MTPETARSGDVDLRTGDASRAEDELPNSRHTIVVGGGLVGITTAYHLRRTSPPNTRITLIEAAPTLASVSSFANAGRFCPNSLQHGPPAKPSVVSSVLSLLWPFGKDASDGRGTSAGGDTGDGNGQQSADSNPGGLVLTPGLVHWGIHFLRNCTPGRHAANCAAHRALASLSISSTEALYADAHMDLSARSHRHPGTLYLYGSVGDFETGRAKAEKGAALGIVKPSSVLSSAACIERFPWLANWAAGDGRGGAPRPLAERIPGGAVVAEGDFTVDSRKFAFALADAMTGAATGASSGASGTSSGSPAAAAAPAAASAAGDPCGATGGRAVNVRLGQRVERLLMASDVTSDGSDDAKYNGKRADGVILESGETVRSDRIIICGGLETGALLSRGLRRRGLADAMGSWWVHSLLPVQPMMGCSIDLTGCSGTVPTMALADYGSGSLNLQMTPMEHGRLRLVGHAIFASRDAATPAHTDAILRRCRHVLPGLHWDGKETHEGQGQHHRTWVGLRPMTPDGLPIIGRPPGFENVYVNVGHGAQGWTTSMATAKVLARAIQADADVHGGAERGRKIRTSSSEHQDEDALVALLVEACKPERFTVWNFLFS